MRRVSTPVCCSSWVMTGPNVWPSNGLPCKALACSTNWPPLGLVAGVAIDTLPSQGQALAAELVRRPRFPFANALHLRGVQRIDLGAALAVILEAYPHRQSEKVGEALLEPVIAGDLAANVADHPAQPDAQEFECAPRPLELVGMGIAADHDRSAFGHPPITLPQPHSVAFREIDQLLQRAVA